MLFGALPQTALPPDTPRRPRTFVGLDSARRSPSAQAWLLCISALRALRLSPITRLDPASSSRIRTRSPQASAPGSGWLSSASRPCASDDPIYAAVERRDGAARAKGTRAESREAGGVRSGGVRSCSGLRDVSGNGIGRRLTRTCDRHNLLRELYVFRQPCDCRGAARVRGLGARTRHACRREVRPGA